MNPIQRFFYRYPKWIFLIISAFILPLMINLISSWLEVFYGINAARLLIIIAILVAITLALAVPAWLSLRHNVSKMKLVPGEKAPPKFDGLILFVGPGAEGTDPLNGPTIPAIEFHSPKVIWIITTLRGAPVSEIIKEKYNSPTCKVVILKPLIDPFSLQESYEAVRDIYQSGARECGLEPSKIIADFTGGTHPMAAGMVLACQDLYDMQYMKKGEFSRPIWIRFQADPTGIKLSETEVDN